MPRESRQRRGADLQRARARARARAAAALVPALGIALLGIAACSGSARSAQLVVPARVRVTVGETRHLALVSGDAPARLRIAGGPTPVAVDGRRLRITATDAGRSSVTVVAEGEDGREVRRRVTIDARYPAHDGVLVGLGDSVGSGHGLQLGDYLGDDPCWRDTAGSYPARVADQAGLELVLVACSGAEAAGVRSERVTGGLAGTAPPGERLDQVEWAVRANPALVTVTLGANDLDFDDPVALLDGASLRTRVLDERLRALAAGLDGTLRRLVDATDATVAVTTYHDPTAGDPYGVDGCRRECFADAAATVVDRLDETIRAAVARVRSARVVLVDVRARFEDHGAPNGLGIDAWRDGDGAGPLDALFQATTAGVQPFCARTHDHDDSWVNAIDCVHPDERGAQEYADAVSQALALRTKTAR